MSVPTHVYIPSPDRFSQDSCGFPGCPLLRTNKVHEVPEPPEDVDDRYKVESEASE